MIAEGRGHLTTSIGTLGGVRPGTSLMVRPSLFEIVMKRHEVSTYLT
jgi:hypothetical protein